MSRTISKVWLFASSSGKGNHETIQYSDASLSCSCPGWCKRTQPDGSRTCRHVRLVIIGQGLADAEAVSVSTKAPTTTTAQPQPKTYGTKSKTKTVGTTGAAGEEYRRKIC